MSLTFYIDHNVPAAITAGLRRRGVDCLTADEDGRSDRPDEELLQRAADLGRVVFTMDDDFLTLAAAWRAAGRLQAGVVYLRQNSITYGQAIDDLELIAVAVAPAEMVGDVRYLPV